LEIVIVERITDLIALVFLALTAGLVISSENIYIIFLALVGLIFFIILFRSNIFYNFFGKLPVISKYAKQIKQSGKKARELLNVKNLFISTIISIVSWSMEGIGLFLILDFFGVVSSIHIAIFIFSFSSVFGAVSMLPAGIGAVEVSYSVLLMNLVQISATTATAVTLISRITTLWFGVFVGVLFLLLFNKFFKKRGDLN
jgi:uncharacterized protein (TIRG00374 family)